MAIHIGTSGWSYEHWQGVFYPQGLPPAERLAYYVRLHGPDRQHLYAGSYSQEDLQWWAQRIREWESLQREVFVYFNNDGFGHAVRNAASLKGLLAGRSERAWPQERSQ